MGQCINGRSLFWLKSKPFLNTTITRFKILNAWIACLSYLAYLFVVVGDRGDYFERYFVMLGWRASHYFDARRLSFDQRLSRCKSNRFSI